MPARTAYFPWHSDALTGRGDDMTKNTEQDVAFIRALADLLRESDLAEIEVEREYGEDDELKVRLTRSRAPETLAPVHHHAVVSPAPPSAHAVEAAPQPAQAQPEQAEPVTSPMVGTVYLAPEPGSANFVSVGDTVEEGDTLLIIEAMKTMNQIPSPVSGTVQAVLVSNAEPVEFGAPLMVIS